MATSFVFSPVPRFYQLASKSIYSPFTQPLPNITAREELLFSTNAQLEDHATNERPLSPLQTSFLDFFTWTPSANSHSQRFYTASLCCSGDEVIESSKTDKNTRPVEPITPPLGYFSKRRSRNVAASFDPFIVQPTPITPASNQTVSRQGFGRATKSESDCSDWLSLGSYKRPLTVASAAPNPGPAPQDRITTPPGSKSRLARILNGQNKDHGNVVFSSGVDAPAS